MRAAASSLALAAALAGACAPEGGLQYAPAPQILPRRLQKLAVLPVIDGTEHFGIDDKLTQAIIDAFLRNDDYPLVPKSEADGLVVVRVRRYLNTPTAYDASLVPTAYKMEVILDLRFVDRKADQILWEEPALEGSLTYAQADLPGGITESQARNAIWGQLAPQVVQRVVDGFGTETGISPKYVPAQPPSGLPPAFEPPKPVNSNPY